MKLIDAELLMRRIEEYLRPNTDYLYQLRDDISEIVDKLPSISEKEVSFTEKERFYREVEREYLLEDAHYYAESHGYGVLSKNEAGALVNWFEKYRDSNIAYWDTWNYVFEQKFDEIKENVSKNSTIKIRDLLSKEIDIDVYDDIEERVGIAFCGPKWLKEAGIEKFKDILDIEVEITGESALLLIEGEKDEDRKLDLAEEFFNSLAGYCTPEEYSLWFSDEPLKEDLNDNEKLPPIVKESPFSDITVNGKPFENINDAFKELVDLATEDKDYE